MRLGVRPLGLVGVPCGPAGGSSHLISRAGGKNKFTRLLSATSAQGYGGRQVASSIAGDREEVVR
jgi:hypothetical protein